MSLVSAQRAGEQARHVPLAAAPGGLVFLGSSQQLLGELFGLRAFVNVDLGCLQQRMLTANHPQQATQSGLLQVDLVFWPNSLSLPGHHEQTRKLTF
ncbi:polyketide synthase pks5 domain protein [Mycobacterium ulcerans str. Harvey]|uniref:Polyketide synthase pks5 domain protein n=1 Tax=Mycobacterium ulcerans str. Harvey TaxID=1299332 RepID=A0ABN0R0D5_MYCUL|nr:polyketide synthase pks5 domain protein [Mycobacterium ulcerans str. Harvey]